MIRAAGILAGSDVEAKLRNLLNDPRRRGVVTRILNAESRKILKVAEELAEDELHRRPDDRRSKESLAHGKHYHDSFRIIDAKERNGRLQAGITNDHPAAMVIEKGAKPHPIDASDPDHPLFWPLSVRSSAGGVGQLGSFPVTFEEAQSGSGAALQVDHPGVQPHRIMRRARDTYYQRARRQLNR